MPNPNCRVVDQLVVPRPNKYASSAVFSPMTGVSKVVAQHLNVMSQMCEELQPKVDGEVHQDLNANLEETESQLLVKRKVMHGWKQISRLGLFEV